MKAACLTAACLVIMLGVLQIISAPRFFHGLSSSALWFASGGLALILTGVLNLLNRAYGHWAGGLAWSCRCANVAMAVFLALDGIVDQAEPGPFLAVMALMLAAIGLSFSRTARHPRPQGGAE